MLNPVTNLPHRRDRIARRRASCSVAVALAACASLWAPVAGRADDAKPPLPAEEARLNIGVFRAAMQKRGLTELLDLHLKDFPPKDDVEALLLVREVKLAEFADTSRLPQRRRAALHEANDVLRKLIDEHGDDLRRGDWLLALVRSLLYQDAEPLITRILYQGGRDSDREALRPVTDRAVATAAALIEYIDKEYDRVDAMSVAQFEQLERTGYIAQLDQLKPQAQYIQLWALFYDALAYGADDPHSAKRLSEVHAGFVDFPELISTAHEQSRVQIQALTLLGMTYRRLNQNKQARDALRRAIMIGDRLDDPAERERVAWAVQLARIERIRNERDCGQFDAAMRALDSFDRSLPGGEAGFGMELIAAMERRAVHRVRAAIARKQGDQREAAAQERLAWQPLLNLTETHFDRRSDVYTMVYEHLDPAAPDDEIDPFERCALVAGLLMEAGREPDRTEELLERAVQVGDAQIEKVRTASSKLAGELVYNIGIAEYQLGRDAAAARRFLDSSRNYPDAVTAQRAANLAVELAANVYAGDPDAVDLQALYADALTHLFARFPDSEQSRYWRFFYAELLDRRGEFDAAARQYAAVDASHEHYIESLFLELRARSQALTSGFATGTLDARRRVDELFERYRAFVTTASVRRRPSADDEAAVDRSALLVRARVLVAEALVGPSIGRYAEALELLAGFEADLARDRELSARVWRVRLTAYQELGRLDEAARAIPAFLAADPADAGPTLQTLFAAVAADVRPASFGTLDEPLRRKAELALMLAEQIHTWAVAPSTQISDAKRRAVVVQLAEASLWANQNQRAWELFNGLHADPEGAQDRRVVFGLAEALFRLERYAEALDIFNELAGALAPDDVLRWRALLRDLQCRDRLGHDPAGIIKVIEQQKYLFPQMGGSDLAPLFDKLLHDAKRRGGQR